MPTNWLALKLATGLLVPEKEEMAKKARSAYGQLQVALQHWVSRAGKRRRQVIGFHERRYKAEREDERNRLLAYYDRQHR